MNPQPNKKSAPSSHEAPAPVEVGNQPTPHGADYSTLLNHLHRGGAWAYYWQAAHLQPVWFPAGNPAKPPTKGNVYFCVHPGRERRSELERGGLVNVAALNCMFSEYDCKDYGSQEAIIDHLLTLPIAPSVVINSGGGVHCYWLLKEPVMVNGNLEALKDVQSRWVEFTGGDKGAKDLARVLRVPGTLNHKYSPPREVSIMTADFEKTFTFEELTAILPEKPADPTPARPANVYRPAQGADLRPIDAHLVGQSFADVLTPHGWKLLYTRGEVEYWQRPGKQGEGISATVGHDGHDILYVFSSNAAPFEPETGYSLATVYVLLNHGGDFKAAAQALKPQPEPHQPPPPPEPPEDFPPGEPPADDPMDANPEDDHPRYIVKGGAIYSLERTKEGQYYRRLCNFNARIDRQIVRDDGQTTTRHMQIAGGLDTGERFPQVRVCAEDFASMAWTLSQWGARAIITAGQSAKDKIREAIQVFSKDAETTTVYTYTGWSKIDGKRVYLTTSGAVGLPDSQITVELDGKKQCYAIPTRLEGVNLCEAVKASLRLLELAPARVVYPLYGAMFLAPLAEMDSIDFVLWLHGETGSMKSVMAAMFLNHYGQDFSYKQLPEGWSTTWMALEKSAFTVKDAPLVIDDYAPQGSSQDVKYMRSNAEKLLRNIANQAPRNRLDADTNEKPGFPARGLVLSTAELMPPGTESIIARTFMVEMRKRNASGQNMPEIDLPKLNKAQGEANLLPYAMHGYLVWLSEHWGEVEAEYKKLQVTIRDELLKSSAHPRYASATAKLLGGIKMAFRYAQAVGALTAAEAARRYEAAHQTIMQLAATQSENIKAERPSRQFLNAVTALIGQGDYYLAQNLVDIHNKAKLIGWVNDDGTYLIADIAYHAVAEYFRAEGETFRLPKRELYAMLALDGFISPGDDRSTVPRKFNGTQYRVLHFKANWGE
jgi:hypothetical protein